MLLYGTDYTVDESGCIDISLRIKAEQAENVELLAPEATSLQEAIRMGLQQWIVSNRADIDVSDLDRLSQEITQELQEIRKFLREDTVATRIEAADTDLTDDAIGDD